MFGCNTILKKRRIGDWGTTVIQQHHIEDPCDFVRLVKHWIRGQENQSEIATCLNHSHDIVEAIGYVFIFGWLIGFIGFTFTMGYSIIWIGLGSMIGQIVAWIWLYKFIQQSWNFIWWVFTFKFFIAIKIYN